MKKYAIILFSSFGFAQQLPSITVIGEGSVSAVPDIVNFSVSVETTKSSPIEAKKENDIAIRKVISFLEGQKLSNKDYQTDHVNLYKSRDYNETEKVIFNYVANQKITISLKDIKKYDDIILGLLNSGITNIDSVDFDFKNREQLLTKAREEAIKDAKKKAQEYVTTAGASLGKVIFITENINDNLDRPVFYASLEKSVGNSRTIAVGERKIKTQVKVVFEIK